MKVVRITWFIGNGFDVNIGLKTSYSDFRKRVYFSEKHCDSPLKDKLIEKLVAADIKDLSFGQLWSDLEELLGRAAGLYTNEEVSDFSATFQEMETLLVDYAHRQESRLPDILPTECVEEFKDTVACFDARMAAGDRRLLGLSDRAENRSHRFVSLNYTQAFAKFLKASADADGVIHKRRVGSAVCTDTVGNLLYVHGSIGEDGISNSVVFGVDSPEQLDNHSFAHDALFTELWVKADRNTNLFANTNEDDLHAQIANADVFCVYGCSMGSTDGRIWRAMGKRLVDEPDVKLVLFIFGLGNRLGPNHTEYQTVRESSRHAFQNAASLNDEQMAKLEGRIFFVSSKDYFRVADTIGLGPDPFEDAD